MIDLLAIVALAPHGVTTLSDLASERLSAASASVAPGVVAGPIPNPANGHVYYLLESSNWSTAQETARTLGGHLVTINDDHECDWIFDRFTFFGGKARALWCGLTDSHQEGVYQWVSGEFTEFENWAAGEPNAQPEFSVIENYVFLYPTENPRERRWRDASDDAVERFLPTALWAAVEDTVFDCQGLVEVAPAAPHSTEPRIRLRADRISITWEGRAKAAYQLQSTDRMGGDWSNVGAPIAVGESAEGPTDVEVDPHPGARFFRVLQVR